MDASKAARRGGKETQGPFLVPPPYLPVPCLPYLKLARTLYLHPYAGVVVLLTLVLKISSQTKLGVLFS